MFSFSKEVSVKHRKTALINLKIRKSRQHGNLSENRLSKLQQTRFATLAIASRPAGSSS